MLIETTMLLILFCELKKFYNESGYATEIEYSNSQISGKVSAYYKNKKYHETEMHSRNIDVPLIVEESLGKRSDYSFDGKLISRWDSSANGYSYNFTKHDKALGYQQKSFYEGGFLRKIEIERETGSHVSCEFNSEVFILYGNVYLAYIKDPGMLFNNYDPYVFKNGKCTETYTDKRSFKNEYRGDSLFQTSYSKNGQKTSELICFKARDIFCKESAKSEWKEDGSPIVTQEVILGGKIKHTRYYNNGSKNNEMFLLRGKMDSTLTYWRENGTLEEVIYYTNGKEIKSVKYDSSGKTQSTENKN